MTFGCAKRHAFLFHQLVFFSSCFESKNRKKKIQFIWFECKYNSYN